MSQLSWHDNFSINVADIDEQHRNMFDLAVGLHRSLSESEAPDVQLGQLDTLMEVTSEHFAYEEALMEKYDYPDLDCHRKQHEDLLSQLAEFRAALSRGRSLKLTTDFDVADDWVLAHVNGADKKLGTFLNEKQVF